MSIDTREMRNALGRFATGVCIISTVTNEGEALGLTANSFASVSLDPPLVLWSLQNDSEVFNRYSSTRYYAINFLAQQQQELSARYAKKGDHVLASSHFTPGKFGAPILNEAVASLECELHATHAGGDHVIIVGKVVNMQVYEGRNPLLFFAGTYRELK